MHKTSGQNNQILGSNRAKQPGAMATAVGTRAPLPPADDEGARNGVESGDVLRKVRRTGGRHDTEQRCLGVLGSDARTYVNCRLTGGRAAGGTASRRADEARRV